MAARDETRIVEHVEHCAACQASLDRLTRADLGLGGDWNTVAIDLDDRCAPAPTGINIDAACTIAGDPTEDPRGTIEMSEPGFPDPWRQDAPAEDPCGTIEMTDPDGPLVGRSAVPPEDLCATVATADPAGDPRATLALEGSAAADGGETISDGDGAAPTAQDPFATLQPEHGEDVARGAVRGPSVRGYEILGRLGEGGMGVVYRARHRGLNRLVALKMIRGGVQARSDSFSRFRVEAESVARLHHPNIIQIYDIGEEDGLPYVVLELLEGGSLQDRLAGDPQAGRTAAELLWAISQAVNFAHEAGIIHRDLKPSNILFSSDGVPKITDFGLAKRVDGDDGQTLSGQVMGSPSYMAPEQARGDSRYVGPPADVHALGAILYEMLAGRVPYRAATVLETLRQVVDDDPVTPSRLVPRVPRDLETICMKCLQKDPARRYPTAGALAADLRRYLDGEPIAARPIAGWERAAKWARRRPGLAASIVLGVLLAGGLVAGLFARQDALLARSLATSAALADAPHLEREAAVARAASELTDAKRRIVDFLHRLRGLEDDPRIGELSGRLGDTLGQLDSRLAALQARQSERERAEADRDKFREFRERLNVALFHTLSISDRDPSGDSDAARREAAAALGIYGVSGPGDSWTMGPMPASLSPEERAEVVEGCYELLLVVSQAEATPESGLRRLDQASALRPAATRAYHLRRASCLDRAGDRRSADKERGEAEGREVATAFDHYLAGQELYARHEAVAALGHLAATLRERPGHFGARCLSALCEFQLGHAGAARAGFTACLDREPGFAWLYILRGIASGVAPKGASPEEVRLGAEMAEADFRRAAELLDRRPNPEMRYILLVDRAALDYQRGRYDEAAGSLLQAIAIDGRKYPAYATMAAVRKAQGRTREALEQFARAIERRPGMAALHRARAEVVLAARDATPADRAQALSDLDRAIGLEGPGDPLVARDQTDRGRLLAHDGRPVEALTACDAAIARVPDYLDAHRLRLDLLLGLKRHGDAVRSCDALIARGKGSATIHERRALAREAARDFPGAVDDLTAALTMGGDPARLHRGRGWLYIVADAPRLALHDFEEAIRLEPSSADALVGRGLARLRLGQHREAVADAEAGLAIGEPGWELLYKSARIYALAAVVVAAEARKRGLESVRQSNRYQDRAAALLVEAIRRAPEDRRSGFFREIIETDHAFDAIRRRVLSRRLAGVPTSPATVADARVR